MNKAKIISMALLLLIGCERKNDIGPAATITGLLNNSAWEQSGWTFRAWALSTAGIAGLPCSLKTIDMAITKINPQGYDREQLSIMKLPSKAGTYPIYKIYPCAQNEKVGGAFYHLASDGDVLRAVFDVVESADNYITVEKVDSVANRISGIIQVTLATTPDNRSSETPYDTVRITNCRFSIPLGR